MLVTPYDVIILVSIGWGNDSSRVTKPLLQPMQIFYQLDPSNSNFEENAFENVICKMSAILFVPQCAVANL